jgi:hypothetical protein
MSFAPILCNITGSKEGKLELPDEGKQQKEKMKEDRESEGIHP